MEEGSIPQLKIYRADTGEVFQIPAPPSTPVAAVKDCLAGHFVAPVDQILLCDKQKLEDERSLESYGLPAEDKPVFLFNRKSFQRGAQPPNPTVLGPVEIKMPALAPLVRKPGVIGEVLSYLHEFNRDRIFSKAALAAVSERVALCRQCCGEQEAMAKALEAAVANLNDHNRQISQAFDTFKGHVVVQQSKHQNLLDHFESNLDKLRETPLHPALRTATMHTLIDCVPEDRLRSWAAVCKSEHEQLANGIEGIEDEIKQVQFHVEEENNRRPDVDFEKLGHKVGGLIPLRQEAHTIKSTLAKDHNTVQEKIKEVSDGKVNEASLLEACGGFAEIQKAHRERLERLVTIDGISKNVMRYIEAAKTRLAFCVYERLREVAGLQQLIRESANKLVVFREALTRQKQAFTQLAYTRYLPEAYASSIQEVMRRKAFGAELHQVVMGAAQSLHNIHQQEVMRRQRFLGKNGRYVPKQLIPGLSDPLPDFERFIKMFEYDKALPAIDPDSSILPQISSSLLPLISSDAQSDQSARMAMLENDNEKLMATVEKYKRLHDEAVSNLSKTTSPRMASGSEAQERRIQMLEEQIAADRAEKMAEGMRINSDMDKLVAENEELTRRVAKQKEDNKIIDSQLKAAHMIIIQNEDELKRATELKQQVLALEKANEKAQTDLSALQRELEEMRRERDALKNEVALEHAGRVQAMEDKEKYKKAFNQAKRESAASREISTRAMQAREVLRSARLHAAQSGDHPISTQSLPADLIGRPFGNGSQSVGGYTDRSTSSSSSDLDSDDHAHST